MNEKKTIVINLIGSPGVGKSTFASYLFFKLKNYGFNCELVSEFAKELVWEERNETFKDELYIFGKQQHRFFRLKGKVDFIITDRPIILSAYYNKKYGNGSKAFQELVLENVDQYYNVDIILQRSKKYNTQGRNETEEESDQMSIEIRDFLANELGLMPTIVDGKQSCIDSISFHLRMCDYINHVYQDLKPFNERSEEDYIWYNKRTGNGYSNTNELYPDLKPTKELCDVCNHKNKCGARVS